MPSLTRSMTDNPWHVNERKLLTPQQRARLFVERGGQCHRCKRKLRPGDKWSDEHLEPLWDGGTNDWDNRHISCEWCKPIKDGEETKVRAKRRRTRTKHVLPSEDQGSKRPMPGSRRSKYKRRMDGTVEIRNAGEE